MYSQRHCLFMLVFQRRREKYSHHAYLTIASSRELALWFWIVQILSHAVLFILLAINTWLNDKSREYLLLNTVMEKIRGRHLFQSQIVRRYSTISRLIVAIASSREIMRALACLLRNLVCFRVNNSMQASMWFYIT